MVRDPLERVAGALLYKMIVIATPPLSWSLRLP